MHRLLPPHQTQPFNVNASVAVLLLLCRFMVIRIELYLLSMHACLVA